MPRVKQKHEQNAMAQSPDAGGLTVKGRLWVEKDGQTFLSWGRVVLLERIGEHGSVSAAAKSMNMSFSHAWRLVEEMNHLADHPLVGKQTGGKGGGGAWLTDEGVSAVNGFWKTVNRFQNWISSQSVD